MIRAKNLSLRYILIASLMAQVLVAVSLTGYFSWKSGRKTVEELALRLSREVTSHTEQHVANYLDTPTLFLKLNRALAASQRLDLNDLQDLRANFWQQTQIDPQIDTLYFGSESGDFIEVEKKGQAKMAIRDASTAPNWHMYRLDSEGEQAELIGKKAYDPRKRPWYRAAKIQQDLVWSPIYLFADPPVLGITPAVPLQDAVSKKFQGVMAIDITLDEISEFLSSLKISDSGRAFIIERSGEMVATSTNNSLIVRGEDGSKRLHSLDSADLLIKTTASLLERELNNSDNIDRQQLILKIEGNRYFVRATSLNNYPGLDWLIVTVIPESDFLLYMRRNTYTTLALSGLALAAAISIGAIANQSIVNSVTRISVLAKAISQGQKIVLETQPQIKELALVSESIKSMAQQLKTSSENIKDLQAYNQQAKQATSNLKQKNQYLHRLANIDSLTQIHNRYHFDLALQQLWSAASQQQTAISLIMCDIDNFKLYNDTYGHLMGDRCLTKVAQAIKRGANRQQDIVARYGGEEFVVILPNMDISGIAAVAQKIVNYTHQLNIVHSQSVICARLTISCGVASMIPQPDDSAVELIQAADEALYEAKRQGKNRYILAG